MARSIGTGGRYATLPANLVFDARGLDALSRDLYAASEKLKAESRVVLTELGEKVMDDAKAISRNAPTKSGSNTVAETMEGNLIDSGLTYQIKAGTADDPIAGLWELGNRAKGSSATTFWHPVYGRGRVYQNRYPFFKPALKKNRYIITKLIYQMWDRVLTEYRLSPTSTDPFA